MVGFMRTTVLGGLLFLFPIVFIVAILGKALEVTNKLSAPLAGLLPIDSIGGLAVVNLLALVILVLICFLAGLTARTPLAGKFLKSLETNVLGKIPAYTLLKSKAESALHPEDIGGMERERGSNLWKRGAPLLRTRFERPGDPGRGGILLRA